jgi:protein-disulfide isomerase
VEFSDFGCYYCTTFYNNTFNRLVQKYVDSGQVRFVYKHMPITSLHPGADMAALASECAADQGKFWDYHNVLFARNANGFAKELMIQYASEMKLDATKFTACLDKAEIGQRVQVDMAQAADLGLRGTPSFLVNGKQLIGAQPYEVFAQAIEQALGKK